MFDVLIVGGGPAALTAAIYSRRAGKSVLIVERMVPGGQIALTNTVENYPGIKKTDGMTLATMMFEHAQSLGTQFVFSDVLEFSLEGKVKKIRTHEGTFEGKVIILCLGASARALSSSNPSQGGTAQNPDVFFQNREASNVYYDKAYSIIQKTMEDFEKVVGRKYRPFEYYGNPNAENVVIVMGSASQTFKDVVKTLEENKEFEELGKVGVLNVRLFRPWNANALLNALPKTVKNIAVLDRTKESGALGEPLLTDVKASLYGKNINIIGGRYGLGSKELTREDAVSVFENLAGEKKNPFTVGICDDITNLSLPLSSKTISKFMEIENNSLLELMFFGLGSDGTVSANKNSIKIIGNSSNKFVQGYFEYDSKKSGSLTVSHLRVSDEEILMPYEIDKADFIAIHNYSFINKFDIISIFICFCCNI